MRQLNSAPAMMRSLSPPLAALVALGLLLGTSAAHAREASTPGPAKARRKEGSTLTLRFMASRNNLPPPHVFFAGREVKLPRPLPHDTDLPVRVPASGWTLMTLKWGRGTKHIFLALGEPFTLELSDDSGPALKPPVPGLKCLRLKPPPAGLRWFAEVGPLPEGRAFSEMECGGSLVYRDVCALYVGRDEEDVEGASSLLFVPTLPGLYSFEVRKGRILGRFDPGFGGRASPPATCDAL